MHFGIPIQKCLKIIQDSNSKIAKTADRQAQNASHCDAFWACRSAVFAIFDFIRIVALWIECDYIVALCSIIIAPPPWLWCSVIFNIELYVTWGTINHFASRTVHKRLVLHLIWAAPVFKDWPTYRIRATVLLRYWFTVCPSRPQPMLKCIFCIVKLERLPHWHQ